MTATGAERRATVLVHLVETLGRQVVTPEAMAVDHPELPANRWATVLENMCQPACRLGGSVPPARLLHVVAGDPATYALAPGGWMTARRLTAKRGAT